MHASDRFEASTLLAQRLRPYGDLRPLFLVARRETLALGRALADALNSEPDVHLVQPLATPSRVPAKPDGDESFRFGGTGWWWPHLLVRRRPRMPGRPAREICDSVVILVDDGATDAAALGTIASLLRRAAPRRFVAAFVAASDEAVNALVCRVDELVCLEAQPPLDEETVSRVREELAGVDEEDFAMAFDALWARGRAVECLAPAS
jgi:predicted phosphoribosyltransferase